MPKPYSVLYKGYFYFTLRDGIYSIYVADFTANRTISLSPSIFYEVKFVLGKAYVAACDKILKVIYGNIFNYSNFLV